MGIPNSPNLTSIISKKLQKCTDLKEELIKIWQLKTSYTGLFMSPSGISELDCATTKTDTAERSISIGRESLQVFFFVLGTLTYFQVPPTGRPGLWARTACSFHSAQAATLLEFMYNSRIVLSVVGSVWYMIRNLRRTVTIDSVLANSKTQNAF